ncbi:MAG: hypothetical protein Q8P22_13245 [Chloroflexota bacterium]|nr:hypothetical protein [Chloroflexota bacterium]
MTLSRACPERSRRSLPLNNVTDALPVRGRSVRDGVRMADRADAVWLGDGETLLRPILAALVAAGLTELLLLRMLSRVGVHIPKEGLVLEGYSLLTSLGSFAFNVATVLAPLSLVALTYLLTRSARVGPAALGIATLSGLLALLFWSLVLPLVGTGPEANIAFGMTSAGLLVLLAAPYWTNGEVALARRIAVGLMVAAFLCSAYYTLSNTAYHLLGWTGSPPYGLPILGLGEALVVATGFAVFWAWGSWRWLKEWRAHKMLLALPSIVAILLLGSYLANGSTSAILALWTTGLTLYLPLPLYLASFWLYLVTVSGCLGGGQRTYEGWALLLLLVAGYNLELTYQHLLAVVAVLVLTRGAALASASASGTAAIQQARAAEAL